LSTRRQRIVGVKGSQGEGLIPIDVAILKLLPAEGTMLAEYIPLGTSAGAVKKRLDNVLTGPQVGGRLMAMSLMGYVIDVPMMPVSRGKGWQRTQKAVDLIALAEELGDVFKAVEQANHEHFAKIVSDYEAASSPEGNGEIPDDVAENWTRREEDV